MCKEFKDVPRELDISYKEDLAEYQVGLLGLVAAYSKCNTASPIFIDIEGVSYEYVQLLVENIIYNVDNFGHEVSMIFEDIAEYKEYFDKNIDKALVFEGTSGSEVILFNRHRPECVDVSKYYIPQIWFIQAHEDYSNWSFPKKSLFIKINYLIDQHNTCKCSEEICKCKK